DLDGDGKPDIVVSNQGSGVSVFRNKSTVGSITAASFQAEVRFTSNSATASHTSLTIDDMDGDSKPDIIVCNYLDGTVSVLRNVSVPGAMTPSSFSRGVEFSTGSQPVVVKTGDLDGDGKSD